jgi:hypothetical protein
MHYRIPKNPTSLPISFLLLLCHIEVVYIQPLTQPLNIDLTTLSLSLCYELMTETRKKDWHAHYLMLTKIICTSILPLPPWQCNAWWQEYTTLGGIVHESPLIIREKYFHQYIRLKVFNQKNHWTIIAALILQWIPTFSLDRTDIASPYQFVKMFSESYHEMLSSSHGISLPKHLSWNVSWSIKPEKAHSLQPFECFGCHVVIADSDFRSVQNYTS